MMGLKNITLKCHNVYLLVSCTLIIQILIVILFKNRLENQLPTYFSFTGKVISSFDYQRPIILPGILLLLIIHIAGLLLYRYLYSFLKRIPIFNNYLPNPHYVSAFILGWIECVSWPILLYFFVGNYLVRCFMLVINMSFLFVLVVKIIHVRRKSVL